MNLYRYLLLSVFAIIVFSPAFFNDFQYKWDDQWMLLEQPFVMDFSWYSMKFHFLNFYHGQYSPVNTLFYSLIYSLFGLNAGAFHAACLIVHIANVLLVYAILRTVLKQVKTGWKAERIERYASIVAMLFAVHPLQVESVAWISASKVLLYGFFCLAGIGCYLRYLNSEKGSWYRATFICYLLAFGSKEQAILLPLNLVLIDWVMGRYKALRLDKNFISREEVFNKIPFFFVAGGMWYFSFQNNLGNIETDGAYPFYQRIIFGAHSLVQYIFRFIAPVKLYYWYFYPMPVGQGLPASFWIYPLLAAIVLLFVQGIRRKPNTLPLFGIAFFLINLLLALHMLPMPRATITADRYMYLSVIGLALVSVWLVDYSYQKYRNQRKIIVPIAGIVILAFSAQSFIRTTEWKNTETLRQNIEEAIEKRKKAQDTIVNNPPENDATENQQSKETETITTKKKGGLNHDLIPCKNLLFNCKAIKSGGRAALCTITVKLKKRCNRAKPVTP
ncbi:ArnT family glycosyltransferase [Gaoshiqia sp. Z1-71]|uniref:ArnT family glycosyltransferase n=1 Tax=Gaoshiqia hydrogeniformans TaxID=3290090 RepID=UPI003BF82B3E